jgi:hypothetical protein
MRFEGWKLGYIEVWWLGGIYSPNHQKNRWWGLLSYGAPDSPVRHRTLSGAPATSPNRWVPTVGASDNWVTGQSSGAPDSHYSLSGAPSCAALTSARAGAHCSLLLFCCRRSLVLCSRYSAGTPDSPVLHRTVRWIIAERLPEFPKVASSELGSLVHWTLSGGAPDTVRWHTGQSGVLDQGCLGLSFALFIWTLSWTFIDLCWTFGTCRTQDLEQTS